MPVRATSRLPGPAGAALALLLAGCGGADEHSGPVDGGWPLDTAMSNHAEALVAADPCWRREPGGWHLSIGHCRAMLPPARTTGIWLRTFEESSFFPGATAPPDRNDLRRYTIDLEVDDKQVERLIGRELKGPQGHAAALTLVGRRTRDPINVDCYGSHYFTFVVDRLESARYLGVMADPDPPPLPSERTRYVPFKPSGKGGVVGRMEAEAAARCGGQD